MKIGLLIEKLKKKLNPPVLSGKVSSIPLRPIPGDSEMIP